MKRFHYVSYAQEIMFAAGLLAQAGQAMERFGWRNLMLCANQSMRSNGTIDLIQSSLGERLVAVYERVQPHVQDIQVREALDIAREKNVEAVIGMGGGSPIGMAKALGFESHLPIVAIPTTYAGSEMTGVYGITHTDEDPPRKVTVSDPKIMPKLVLYDPELTLALPPALTASTGINALAHCLEALYSKTRNPISTAAALQGVRHIFDALLICHQDGKNLKARTQMLLGSHLAGFSLASVSMGLHHGLCHVLGGTANVPHGIANAIILPHAIRFNADATATQLIPVAEEIGVPVNRIDPMVVVEALVQKIYHLINKMNLPQRLRDAGVAESDLPRLAQIAFQNRTVQNNPKPITDPAQLETLLQYAW
ncbi:MAG TPA: iron-containing alcohol dehydrogenase [Anaerolineales bacterium]|nr:iron-containing alcohol dehydrogenase [Anaerolineales bacterium]